LRRATKLLLEITGGVAARGVIDIYPNPKVKPTVTISQKRIKQSLGLEIDISKIETVLLSLGFGIVESTNPPNTERVEVTVPYWRSDISIEDDLIEEVARIIGYDNIPTTMLSTPIPHHEPNSLRDMRENLRDSLVSEGMQESISYSLTNIKTLDAVGAIKNGPEPLHISNPMSIDMQVLRTSLRGGILQTLSTNLHISRSRGLKLFEIGNVYLSQTDTLEPDLPEERQVLVGVLAGPRNPLSWLTPPVDMDFFDAKGVLEASLGIFGLVINYLKDTDPIMHPGKTASLSCSNTRVGLVGELHPKTLLHFDIDQPVTMFEIDLQSLCEVLAKDIVGFTNTPRFPESERDFTLTVDTGTPSSDIKSIIEQHSLVVHSVPFDIYSGTEVPSGKKSVTYKVVFQSSKGTLTSVELDQARTDILQRLEREVGAELRSQN
jgi:phenylalanyl-tRNA synthetase beta chain